MPNLEEIGSLFNHQITPQGNRYEEGERERERELIDQN